MKAFLRYAAAFLFVPVLVISLCALVRPNQLSWTPVAVKTFEVTTASVTKQAVTGNWLSGNVVGCLPVDTTESGTTNTVPMNAYSIADGAATVTWDTGGTYTSGTYALFYIPGR